jgi:hypothetical protein
VLDASIPFQASCCEMTGSLCSPLSLYYRDTGTVLYRVQQHCRKLVPQVLTQQATTLATARSAQRGVLDVSDSLQIIDTLNGPVERSLADVAAVAKRAAAIAQARHKEIRAEARRRDQRRRVQMDASGSLPTTPLRSDSAAPPALHSSPPPLGIDVHPVAARAASPTARRGGFVPRVLAHGSLTPRSSAHLQVQQQLQQQQGGGPGFAFGTHALHDGHESPQLHPSLTHVQTLAHSHEPDDSLLREHTISDFVP